jgi:DNA-binding MarR family transcriptional regulator
MTPSSPAVDPAPPARLRVLLQRLELAGHHQRAARARELGVAQAELAALEHLTSDGRLTPKALAHRLGLTSGGLTGLVERLRGAGLVASDQHSGDRRMRILTPTAAGTGLSAQWLEPILAAGEPAISPLPLADAELVGRVLDALVLLKEAAALETGEGNLEAPVRYRHAILM